MSDDVGDDGNPSELLEEVNRAVEDVDEAVNKVNARLAKNLDDVEPVDPGKLAEQADEAVPKEVLRALDQAARNADEAGDRFRERLEESVEEPVNRLNEAAVRLDRLLQDR